MKEKVLFVILEDYADWEGAYLVTELNKGPMPGSVTRYEAKIVAPTLSGVKSLGGFHILPDYSFDTIPKDYAALILIGGDSWKTKEVERVVTFVEDAIKRGKIVGAICGAVSFLAAHGFLNKVKHTGNGVDQLKEWGGDSYTNEVGYVTAQAVSDGHIVTANGTACLEFARELLFLLKDDEVEKIKDWYDFQKNGFVR